MFVFKLYNFSTTDNLVKFVHPRNKDFSESTVSKILDLVENASIKKSKTENFVARMAKVYVPAVMILAVTVGAFMPFVTSVTYSESIYRALMFLVISCPCAIAISVPLSYFSGIGSTDILPELAIDNGEYVLIEMPMTAWTNQMYRELENIRRNFGLTPIVAHVDRYISPMQTYGIPERLMELPVIVQANAGFFQRFSTKCMALRMLEKGQIHLLGSDCHNMKDRTVNIKPAIDLIESKLGQEAVVKLNACERWVLSERGEKRNHYANA